jgi:hypothetical protein
MRMASPDVQAGIRADGVSIMLFDFSVCVPDGPAGVFMPNYVVVSREAHATKRWSRATGYAFAAREAVVPLLSFELPKAVMGLPVAFLLQGEQFVPAAVLGLASGRNLFVAPDGRWLGVYVPAALRSYPFRLAHAPEGQQLLCVDEASGLLLDGQAGESLFNDDGSPAAGVVQVLEFLAQQEADRPNTTAACAALQAAGLIVPWTITVQ